MTLPLGAIQAAPQNRVVVVMIKAILGKPGTLVMAIAILILTFGCNNGLMMAGAPVYLLWRKRLGAKEIS